MILHLDGDNFFVSCELLRRRDLVGKAVVVGEERGIATAMNVEAKKLGITRGYPIYKLRQQWGEKEVAVLPSHFEMYRQLGAQVLRILEKYSSTIEAYSIDENFIDLHELESAFFRYGYFFTKKSLKTPAVAVRTPTKSTSSPCKADFERFASCIQKDIYDSTGLWYSCGVARTKALAKIASKRNKPQGICVIMPENETAILETTPIENVWGIGRRLAPKMKARGIHAGREYRDTPKHVLGDIADAPVLDLQDELKGIVRYSFGNNERPFQKSVETTRAFGFSSTERSFVLSEFSKNVETVCSRLVQLGVASTYVYFFIRTKNKYRMYGESVLMQPTQSPIDVLRSIEKKFETLVDAHLSNRRKDDHGIIGTGICMTECIPTSAVTQSLFGDALVSMPKDTSGTVPSVGHRYSKGLQDVLEGLRDTYGSTVVQLASSLESNQSRGKAKAERNKKDVEITGGEYVYGLPLVYLGEVG